MNHDGLNDFEEEDQESWDGLPNDSIDDDDTLVVGCLFPDSCLAGYHRHYTYECYTAEIADAYDEAMRQVATDTTDSPHDHSPF